MAASDPTRRVQWTEHGPVPIDEPADVGSTDEQAAEPPVAQRAAEDPVAVEEAPPDAMPAPPDAAPDDVDAVRRRLAERGLLRQEPTIRIRDLAEGPAARTVEEERAEPLTSAVEDEAADSAGLDQERHGPGSAVRCPKCRTEQTIADDASGFVCASCSSVWRWAICSSCAEVSLTFARQQSWRCGGCGTSTRSWWRTPTAQRENQLVRERRREDATAARRARAQEVARRRRWKVIATGVTLILLAGVAAAVVTRRSSDAAARGASGRACDAFLAADLDTGASPAQVRADLDDLAAVADAAPDEIRIPAQRLAAAGRPGDPTFESTRAQLSAACRSSE